MSGRATGVVIERRGEIGDRVKAGDVLVVIDAPEIGSNSTERKRRWNRSRRGWSSRR